MNLVGEGGIGCVFGSKRATVAEARPFDDKAPKTTQSLLERLPIHDHTIQTGWLGDGEPPSTHPSMAGAIRWLSRCQGENAVPARASR